MARKEPDIEDFDPARCGASAKRCAVCVDRADVKPGRASPMRDLKATGAPLEALATPAAALLEPLDHTMISSVPSFGFQACVVSCLTNVHGLDRRIASRLVAAMRSHNIVQLRAMGASPEEIAQSIIAFTGGRSVDVLWRH